MFSLNNCKHHNQEGRSAGQSGEGALLKSSEAFWAKPEVGPWSSSSL